jgi:hypothetical protein
MLVILISAIWFSALLVVVALCRIAAHGDRKPLPRMRRSPRLFDSATPDMPRTISLKLEDRRSKTATAEHVRDGSQEDLYVRP